MDRRNLYYAGVLVLYLYQPTATAHAADPVLFGAFGEDDRVRVALEVGYLSARAKEYLYDNGRTVSELIWDVNSAASITGRAEMSMSPRWQLSGSATIGINYDNFMVEYDWLTDSPDWSDRSLSWDTRLDHYVAVDAGASYAFWKTYNTTMKAIGGLRYTDIKMSTYGGEYIYTPEGGDFRSEIGNFPDSERGITYRQRLPVIYGGLGAARQFGSLHLDASVLGGLTVWARDKDNHWNRAAVYKADFDSRPYLALQMRASVPVTDRGEAVLSARYEKHFRMRGDLHITDFSDGTSSSGRDGAGASLQTINVGIGLKFRF